MTDPRTYGGYTLDALLALANAATKGPMEAIARPKEIQEEFAVGPAFFRRPDESWDSSCMSLDEARFYAAAREAVPALIERIRELEKTITNFDLRLDNAVFKAVQEAEQERDGAVKPVLAREKEQQ